jgi:hypothetical protein
MASSDPSTHRRVWWLPGSSAGRWAVGLFALAALAVVVMAVAAVSGPGSQDTFTGDPLLAAPAVVAAGAGVASAILGGFAILRRERALLVLLSTAACLNVLSYVAGEAMRR